MYIWYPRGQNALTILIEKKDPTVKLFLIKETRESKLF